VKFYENLAWLFLSQPKTYGLFPNFKTWVLGVQLRCLRVFNLWCDGSNLVSFDNELVLQYDKNETNLAWFCDFLELA